MRWLMRKFPGLRLHWKIALAFVALVGAVNISGDEDMLARERIYAASYRLKLDRWLRRLLALEQRSQNALTH